MTRPAQILPLALIALMLAGCAGQAPPVPASQPSPFAGVTTRLKADAVAALGVTDADAVRFVQTWSPRWVAAGMAKLEADASGDRDAKVTAAANLKQLEADTLEAAKAAGAGAGNEALAWFVGEFMAAFGN